MNTNMKFENLALLKEWVMTGRKDNHKHIIIVYDLVDKEYFPYYIDHDEVNFEWSKFISESKQKPIISFNLNKHIKGIDFNV